MMLTLCMQVASATLLFTIPEHIAALYTTDGAVIALAAQLLALAAIFQLSDGVQAASNGALRGLKDTRVPMLISGVAYWCVGMPVGLWLAFQGTRSARHVDGPDCRAQRRGGPADFAVLVDCAEAAGSRIASRAVRRMSPHAHSATLSNFTAAGIVPLTGLESKMSSSQPGIVMRLMRGIWNTLNFTRRLILNVILVIVLCLLFAALFRRADHRRTDGAGARSARHDRRAVQYRRQQTCHRQPQRRGQQGSAAARSSAGD
jgi:hypothetical protein